MTLGIEFVCEEKMVERGFEGGERMGTFGGGGGDPTGWGRMEINYGIM